MGCGFVCSCGDYEEEERFFDTREDLSSASDSCPGSPVNHNVYSDEHFSNLASPSQQYDVWIGKPGSIKERRSRFRKWMGLSSPSSLQQDSVDCNSEVQIDIDAAADVQRLTSDGGAVLGSSESLENECSMSGRFIESDNTGNSDDANVLAVGELLHDDHPSRRFSVSSCKQMVTDEFQRNLKQTSFVQGPTRGRENLLNKPTSSPGTDRRERRSGWLKRLGIPSCVVDAQQEAKEIDALRSDVDNGIDKRSRRVKVHPNRKKSKDFSAVFMGQDIKAHDGAIWTMKFSPDGKYLASGGEDGFVRVWHVMQSSWTGEGNFPEEDPSCIYFMANHSFQLRPIYTTNKEKKWKSGSMKRTSDSACIVLPPDVFEISDKPLHEFHGHNGDVLDLSWSNNKHLLSSSVDKTVRLWQVGCENCTKVFPHNDYVTSVQFNPIDERYFISGSIDGKVRIWCTSDCHVVNWIDIKEIVSAVCYRPDGKEMVVGCFTGICRFYCVLADHQLQLGGQICLPGKKKFPYKRITGFQFSPNDSQKLMVTSADSQVIIFDGFDIVCKYKGLRNTGCQISASFTSDGRHIVCASEDSNVYIWKHNNRGTRRTNQVKRIWSSERFFSSNVSVAIPWMEYQNRIPITSEVLTSQQEVFRKLLGNHESHEGCDLVSRSLRPSTSGGGGFSLSPGFFSEYLSKGSATWPEEKLLTSEGTAAPPTLGKSQYKFLRSCCRNMAASPHAWGRVIVTAGWDGRIRSFCNYGLPIGK